MIRIVCDICLRELKGANQPPHLCERCLPFGDEYYASAWENAVKQSESFRQRFLQQTVLKPRQQQPKLEAVK